MKGSLRYKVRLERMAETRLARKVYLVSMANSKWAKKCGRLIDRNSMLTRRVYQHHEDRVNMNEWRILGQNMEGIEWDVRKWNREIERAVKTEGLSKWRNGMETKETLEWYREKEAPKYEEWYEGSLGGDLLFKARAQCMDVNARNYRWSESQSKLCQMCDANVDETVEHVVREV